MTERERRRLIRALAHDAGDAVMEASFEYDIRSAADVASFVQNRLLDRLSQPENGAAVREAKEKKESPPPPSPPQETKETPKG